MATSLSNFFQPEFSSKYFQLQVLEKSALIRAGILTTTPELQAAVQEAGSLVTIPMFNQLLMSDAPSIATDGTTVITAKDVSGAETLARKNFRTQSWKAGNIIEFAATGQDILTPAISQWAEYWAEQDQKLLISMLTGIFHTALAANVNSIFIEAGAAATADNLISSDAIIDTQFVLGDNHSKFTAIAMHSVVYKRLAKLDEITFVPLSQQNLTLIPTYQGLTVIVDDNLPVRAGTTSGSVYTSYLFGAGAVGYAQIPDKPDSPSVELYRVPNAGTGAGTKEFITRNYNILSPAFCSYTGSLTVLSPTDTQLETGSNWTLSASQKRIPIAALITNG